MSICSWNDSHGTSCKWPGPFCADTHGGNRWYCIWHWRAFGLDRLEMKTEGDRAVRESLEWDGTAESYLALRAKAPQAAKAQVAPVQAAVSGQDGGGAVHSVHALVSGVVPDLQPEYSADW